MTPVFKYQGWIRNNLLVWRASCAANSIKNCSQLLKKITSTMPCWTSTLVLPFEETPERSRSIHHGGL